MISSVIRKVARRILEGLEFEIVEAEDGEQALDACRSQMPDAVLLDWNMPKMDGYEFLRVAAPAAGRRSAEGRVLHHRERCRSYRPRAARRRQRVHHETVRQGDRRSQVSGSRADLTSNCSWSFPQRLGIANVAMSIAVAPLSPRAALVQGPIRVMVVDDAVVVRGLMARWIEAEPDCSRRLDAQRPRGHRAAGAQPIPTSSSSTSTCRTRTASRRCRCCWRRSATSS